MAQVVPHSISSILGIPCGGLQVQLRCWLILGMSGAMGVFLALANTFSSVDLSGPPFSHPSPSFFVCLRNYGVKRGDFLSLPLFILIN